MAKRINKILFLVPSFTVLINDTRRCVPPLAFMTMGTVIRRERPGIDIKIIDSQFEGYDEIRELGNGLINYGLTTDEIMKRIESYNPNLIGITNMFSSQAHNSLDLVRATKRNFQDIPVVLGGPHATALPRETMKAIPELDFLVMGEGELAILDLIRYLNGEISLDKVTSLGYRVKENIVLNPVNKIIEDLDWIGRPARNIVDTEGYMRLGKGHNPFSKGDKVASIIDSRGCPYSCTFCGTQRVQDPNWIGEKLEGSVSFDEKFRYRARSPESIVEEINFLRKNYGADEIQFEGDNVIGDREVARKLFKLIEQQGFISHCFPNGVTAFSFYGGDEEKNGYPLLNSAVKAGLYQVSFAIESANPEVRKKIKKPINLARLPNLLKAAGDLGIARHAFFILGFPDWVETLDQVKETVDYAIGLKEKDYIESASFGLFTPIPGAPLWYECLNRGVLPKDFNDYPRLMFGARGTVITSKYWTPEQLLEEQKRGYAGVNIKSAKTDKHNLYKKVIERTGGKEEDIIAKVGKRNA